MNAKLLFIVLSLGVIAASCEEEPEPKQVKEIEPEVIRDPQIIKDSIAKVKLDSTTTAYMKTFNLVDILDIDSSIQVDLRYSSDNNFMGHILYDTLDALFLQEEVAVRVSACQSYLKEKYPSYSLLIYDGVRPLEVQREMWHALDTIPASQRGKFVSNPSYGSVHNFGAAVDLTICDEHGVPLDMGADYDDFRDIAFPSKEWKFLASGELTQEQHENRKLLREVMRSNGFRDNPTIQQSNNPTIQHRRRQPRSEFNNPAAQPTLIKRIPNSQKSSYPLIRTINIRRIKGQPIRIIGSWNSITVRIKSNLTVKGIICSSDLKRSTSFWRPVEQIFQTSINFPIIESVVSHLNVLNTPPR